MGRAPKSDNNSLLRFVAKKALGLFGLNAGRFADSVRKTQIAKALISRGKRRLVTNAGRRRAYVLSTVRQFNPQLSATKPAEIIRAATIWEGAGRFAWLDHANDDNTLELVHLPRGMVNPAWTYFLQEYLELSRSDPTLGEYALDRYLQNRFSDARSAFRDYCAAALRDVRSEYGIEILIMPKLNDDWTIDFINCAKEVGIPVLVDDREGAITPKRLEVVPPRLQALMSVSFDRLCVHNQIHRELFLRAGLPAEKVIVNGAPQSDYWYRPDLWRSRQEIHPQLRDDRILLLFFSFGPRTYLNFYYGDDSRNWAQLGSDFHTVLIELLKHHGDRIQIVYKSGGKPLRDQFPGYETFLNTAEPYMNSDNYLELDGTYSTFDLINNSNVVFGFQTSGMIEAMFRDVPIIYGAWGAFFDEIRDTLLPLHRCDGVVHAKNPSALLSALESRISASSVPTLTESQRASRRDMRERYFSRADGNVSRRLLEHAKSLVSLAAAVNEGSEQA